MSYSPAMFKLIFVLLCRGIVVVAESENDYNDNSSSYSNSFSSSEDYFGDDFSTSKTTDCLNRFQSKWSSYWKGVNWGSSCSYNYGLQSAVLTINGAAQSPVSGPCSTCPPGTVKTLNNAYCTNYPGDRFCHKTNHRYGWWYWYPSSKAQLQIYTCGLTPTTPTTTHTTTTPTTTHTTTTPTTTTPTTTTHTTTTPTTTTTAAPVVDHTVLTKVFEGTTWECVLTPVGDYYCAKYEDVPWYQYLLEFVKG